VTGTTRSAHGSCHAARRLVALARRMLDPEPRALRRAIAGIEDWDALLELAPRHSLLPLLASRLEPLAGELPEAAAAVVRDTRRTMRLTGLATAHASAELLARLAAAGLAATAFKGQVVAVQAYGDALARRSVDLDLLVQVGDREAAIAVLADDGYRVAGGLTRPAAHVLWSGECEAALYKERSLTVELHWQVLPASYGTPLPAGPLLRRSQTVDVLGWPLRAPTPEDAVIIAAVHAYKHFWQCLEHATCVAGLLASPAIDGDRLLGRAAELRAVRRTLVGAAVARELLGAPLPAALSDAVALDSEVRRVTSLALAELWGTLEGRIPLRRIGRSTRVDLRALDRPADLARCVLAKLCLPRLEERNWVQLPDGAAALYYGIRPIRLVWEAIARRQRVTVARREGRW
jgi:hypothetical protein